MTIPELWSFADRADEARLVAAIAADDLLSALLAIAHPSPEDEAAVRAFVARCAANARVHAVPGEQAGERLQRVIVREAGLVGDAASYHAVENSRIDRVIARRRGQPILLACVWILVGRAANIAVEGVPLPGHFLVRVGDQLIDVFAGGVVLRHADVVQLAARAVPGRPFDPAWLAAANVGTIAERVLRNLVHGAQLAGNAAAQYRALRLLAAVRPDDGPLQIDIAMLTERHGAWPDALSMYRGIVKRFADRREAQIAELKLVELERQSRTLN